MPSGTNPDSAAATRTASQQLIAAVSGGEYSSGDGPFSHIVNAGLGPGAQV